jgi:putative transposase
LFEKADNKNERNKRIQIAHIKYGYTLKEIADYLGIHYSTVSRAIK